MAAEHSLRVCGSGSTVWQGKHTWRSVEHDEILSLVASEGRLKFRDKLELN
jgi:hypothetical protein